MQVPTVKLVLKKNKINALGHYPIYLRITAQRKTSFIATGHAVAEKHWDESSESVKESHLMFKEINESILLKKKDMLDQILTASIASKSISSKSLKEAQKKRLHDLFKFADDYIISLKEKRSESLINNWQKHLRKLEAFNNDRKLNFEDITVEYLEKFETHLRDTVAKRSDGNAYIEAIMRTIRTFFNAARKRGLITNYPFSLYEMPKVAGGKKAFLSFKELDRWHKFTFETEHPTLKQSALYFLFACYTGLRLSDWKDFTESKIMKNNISLKAQKNKAWVAVPLHKRLIETIVEMKKHPITIKEPTINRNLKQIAKELKIEKSISTHSGRRTFAVTMCLERGISAETTAKLMSITLAVFERNYSFITPEKIAAETHKAWKDL